MYGIFIYLHLQKTSTIHVGKYTSPMGAMGEIHTLIPAHRPTAKFEMPESQCAQKRKTSIIQAEVLETHTFPSKITAEPNI